jgi:hypothetical protein
VMIVCAMGFEVDGGTGFCQGSRPTGEL